MASIHSNKNKSFFYTPHNAAEPEEPLQWQRLGFPSEQACRFPNIVNIEIFRGECPCACVHCPVGNEPRPTRVKRFGKGGIDLSLFRKVAREVAGYPWATLRLHSVGDPIVWDGMWGVLDIIKQEKVRTWLFTSAVTSDRALLKGICENVDVVEVSVNSVNPGDYLTTKGIDAYTLVESNIRFMASLRKHHNLRLIASRTQTDDQVTDQAFVRFWKSAGWVDDAFVRSYHTYNGLLENGVKGGVSGHQPCLVHWARFNISRDGRAVVCFNELFHKILKDELVLGNIQEEYIQDIWHGPQLSSVREAEVSGRYDGFCKGLPCKNCRSCQPLNGSRQTSEYQINKFKEKPCLL